MDGRIEGRNGFVVPSPIHRLIADAVVTMLLAGLLAGVAQAQGISSPRVGVGGGAPRSGGVFRSPTVMPGCVDFDCSPQRNLYGPRVPDVRRVPEARPGDRTPLGRYEYRQPPGYVDRNVRAPRPPSGSGEVMRDRRGAVRLPSEHFDWCNERYRSYRANDNTFQPYQGPRRPCRSPYQ
ncbi:BA14K family protein [Mesorhizobium xinjiangense]|uniref:BA14K family protein n=1 Tax=Mesorhizobium xinjiangense TaxID=2678685 RepID=UPI001F3D2561|nr:BA14K family protein [Mesorhizobium xinjiangense]